jgi:hypothetical protein
MSWSSVDGTLRLSVMRPRIRPDVVVSQISSYPCWPWFATPVEILSQKTLPVNHFCRFASCHRSASIQPFREFNTPHATRPPIASCPSLGTERHRALGTIYVVATCCASHRFKGVKSQNVIQQACQVATASKIRRDDSPDTVRWFPCRCL